MQLILGEFMEEKQVSLNRYVWIFALAYVVFIGITLAATMFIEFSSTVSSVLQPMLAALVTRMIFVQKELRLITKPEKKVLVRRCFFISIVLSLVILCLFLGYAIFDTSWESVKEYFGTIKLSASLWLMIICGVLIFQYLLLVAVFADPFNTDARVLAGYQKKQAKK